jgi:hypothetical protein
MKPSFTNPFQGLYKTNSPGGSKIHNDSTCKWWGPFDESKRGDERYKLERAMDLVADAVALEQSQREIHASHLANAQHYNNRQLASFDWGTGFFLSKSLRPVNLVSEPIQAVAIDMLTAQVGKNRPKAAFIGRGASWKTKRAADKADKYLWGETVRQGLYSKLSSSFTSACIFGFGGMRHEWVNGKDELTEVHPDQILVDEREAAATGSYSYIFHRRCLPVATVSAKFNIPIEDLLEEAAGNESPLTHRKIGHGFILLVEGWIRATDGGPGRYVAATQKRCLDDQPWPNKWLPFCFYHYNRKISGRGFYQPAVIETLLPFKIRYDAITLRIQEMQNTSGHHWLVPNGSGVDPKDFMARGQRLILYNPGMMPTVVTLPGPLADYYRERDRIEGAMYSRLGLGQMSNASLPDNVRYDSSVALQEANAIQDGRLVIPAQGYEEYILDNFKTMMLFTRYHAGMREMDSDGGKQKIRTRYMAYGKGRGKSYCCDVDWDEIDLDENAYEMQLEASSAHSMTPAAARQRLEDDLGKGIITPAEYAVQVANPDSEAVLTLAAAAASNIEYVVDRLCDGIAISPEPDQDLEYGVKRVTQSLLLLDQYDDVDEDTRTAHLVWLAAAREILNSAVAAGPQGQPAQFMGPNAMPPGM